MAIIWLLLLSPSAPLGWLWLRTDVSGTGRLALSAITVSYAWLSLALVAPSIQDFLLGKDYSYARTFAIPCAHIVVVLVATTFLGIRGGHRMVSVSAGIVVALCWVYVLLISYAV